MIPWTEGLPGTGDFTCSDTLAASYVDKTSRTAGLAAEQGEKRKIDKYKELTGRFVFYPVSVETLGSWGELSVKFIKDIGSRIAALTGEKSLLLSYSKGWE